MATVKFWLGSVGALLYDDSTDYESETGDLIEGLKQMAFAGEKALILEVDVEDLMGPDGNRILKFISNATGVNYFTMRAGSSGSGPLLSTGGPDADVGLEVDKRVEFTRASSGQVDSVSVVKVAPTDATNVGTITGIESDLTGVAGASNVFRGRGGEFYLFADYGLSLYALAYVDSTACPKFSATKARGTETVPAAVKSGDYIMQLIGRAQWGTVSSNRTVAARIDFQATEDHDSTHKGAKMIFNVIPTGSTTLTSIFEIQGTKIYSSQDCDLASGKTYNINGSPHTHTLATIVSPPRTVTDTTTETTTDGTIVCNKGTAMTVNLLAATGSGRIRVVKNIGAGTVTVDGADVETIDGDTTQELLQWESLTIQDIASGVWGIL